MPRVAIIGAGITGLITACALKDAGVEVVVIEAAERAGGPIHTFPHDDLLLETGPHTLLVRSTPVADTLDRLGLTGDIIDAHDAAETRFVVKDGVVTALPSSPLSLATTPLLSPLARLRLLLEPFIPRFSEPDIDETLASFVSRRLGREVYEYFVDPFVSGIWAGDATQLSARHAFPTLVEFEQEAGSIVAGALLSGLRNFQSDQESTRSPRRLLSFEGGLRRLVDACVDRLGDDLLLDSPVRKLRRDADDWRVIYQRGGARRGESADALVLTLSPRDLYDIEWENIDPPRGALSTLRDLPYAPCALAHVAYRRADVEHPLDGLGVLIPSCEGFHILGALFISSMFPNRVPDDLVQLSVFIGGARKPELAALDPGEILDLVDHDLSRLLGTRARPVTSRVIHWDRAIPQYEVGHGVFLDAMTNLEDALPGVFLSGGFRDGIGVPALIEAGLNRADSLQRHLGLSPSPEKTP